MRKLIFDGFPTMLVGCLRDSGIKDDRPGLTKVMDFVQPGDVLVVGRPTVISTEKLEAVMAALEARMSKSAACRNFGKSATLIETLERVGWSTSRGTL